MGRAIGVFLLLVFAQVAAAQSPITSEEIRGAQDSLADIGYDVDGWPGKKTAEAIRRYQADWNLPQTCEISRELIDRLLRKHPATERQWMCINTTSEF